MVEIAGIINKGQGHTGFDKLIDNGFRPVCDDDFCQLAVRENDGNIFKTYISNRDTYFFYLILRFDKFKSYNYSHSPDDYFQVIHDEFMKYGSAMLEELEGDWLLFFYNKQKKEIQVARDHFGIIPLYYIENGDEIFFSSSFNLINRNLKEKILRPTSITRCLLQLPDFSNGTPYKNVYKLLPASHLRINHRGETLQQKYWDIQKIMPDTEVTIHDFVEQLDHHVRQAVKSRLYYSEKPGIMLSSGFDSATYAWYLGMVLDRSQKLAGYTSIPKHDVQEFYQSNQSTNETRGVLALSQYIPNLESRFISSSNVSISGSLENLFSILGRPFAHPVNYYWINDLMRTAREDGTDVLFHGQLGNAILSWPNFVAYHSWQRMNRNRMVWLYTGLKNLAKKSNNKAKLQEWLRESFISDQLMDDLVTGKVYMEDLPDVSKNLIGQRQALLGYGNIDINSVFFETSAKSNLFCTDPSTSKSLVEFTLSAPPFLFYNQSQYKIPLKKMMEKRLPENMINGKEIKGIQAADIVYRIREDSENLMVLLKEMERSQQVGQYLKIPKLVSTLSKFVKQPTRFMTSPVKNSFIAALYNAIFLQSFTKN